VGGVVGEECEVTAWRWGRREGEAVSMLQEGKRERSCGITCSTYDTELESGLKPCLQRDPLSTQILLGAFTDADITTIAVFLCFERQSKAPPKVSQHMYNCSFSTLQRLLYPLMARIPCFRALQLRTHELWLPGFSGSCPRRRADHRS
jgi:hypothetical protein